VSPKCNDTFIRPRQKHNTAVQYTRNTKKEKKLDKRNVREVPKQTFVNRPMPL